MTTTSASEPLPVSEVLLEALRAVARRKGTAYYSEIAPKAGIDINTAYFATHLGRLLDEVNRYEFANGRPLLSAVVISKETGQPGHGYFGCVRDLKRYSSKDDLEIWIEELNLVHDYWSRH